MNTIIDSMISFSISYMNDIKKGNENMKQQAIKEYRDACKLPRKKKKQARKSANLLYSIACWEEDIFNKF